MRKRFSSLIVMLLALLSCSAVCAENTFNSSDGKLTYTISGENVSVKASSKSVAGAVTIPGTVKNDTKTYNVTLVESNGFKDCYDITSVSIGAGVVEIGQEAFEYCGKITAITLPNTLTRIGVSAMNGCSSLQAITIPASVTSIGNAAFHGTDGLKNVTIEDSEKRLDFWNSSDYPNLFDSALDKIYIGRNVWFNNGGGTISTNAKEIVTGGTLSEIKDSLTPWNQNLTKVTIGGAVTRIGSEAFNCCFNLAEVTITAPVTTIGDAAFNSTSISQIALPKTLANINREAFYGCQKLESITIPASVTSIGNAAFYGTDGLKNVTIEDSEKRLDFWNSSDYPNLFQSALDKIYIGRNFWFNNGGGTISTNAKEIVTGGTFGDIKDGFSPWNQNLTKVTIGGVGTRIGSEAFNCCFNLAEVTITAPITTISDAAFNSTSISQIALPKTLANINREAFYGCQKLESITIPASVTSIGNAAFYGTEGLKNVVIENGEKRLDFWNNSDYPNLFDSALDKIYIGRDVWFNNGGGTISTNAKEIVTGGTFGDIKDGFSPWNQNLTKVTIGGVGTRIGSDAFNCCFNLAEVTITAPITTISDAAFNSTPISQITLPKTLERINKEAFRDCKQLDAITIPASVTSIDNAAFYGTDGLKNVVIEDGEKSIWFWNNSDYPNLFESALDKIYIGRNFWVNNGNSRIATSAKTIELGQYVDNISKIKNTNDITRVIAPYDKPFTLGGDNDFSNDTKQNATLFIPWGTAAAYKAAGWNFGKVEHNEYLVKLTTTGGGKVKAEEISVEKAGAEATKLFPRESDVIVEVQPEQDYDFTSLQVNGSNVGVTNGKYTIKKLLQDVTVNATFTIKPLVTISASADGGKADVNGKGASDKVYRDRDAVITFTANEGHYLKTVTVNGADVTSQVSGGKLTLTNIQTNQNVVATFARYEYAITKAATTNGSITLAATKVLWGDNTTATITPASGYMIDHVTLNGKNADAQLSGNTLSINNVRENTEVGATFRILSYKVTTNSDYVKVSNSYPQYGQSVTITVEGYEDEFRFKALKVDGVDVTSKMKGNTYTITSVTGDVKVEAVFEALVILNLNDQMASFSQAAEQTYDRVNYTRNFEDNDWQAIYLPFSVSYETWTSQGIEVARINNVNQYDFDDNGSVDATVLEVFRMKNGSTKPNTPYLVRATQKGKKVVALKDVTVAKSSTAGYSVSSWDYMFTFTGTYSTISGSKMYTNGYYALTDGSLNQTASSANDLAPFRWYMEVADRTGNAASFAREIMVLIGGDEDAETGIVTPVSHDDFSDGKLYDISGRRMARPAGKGIYIQNGKKVAVK